VQVHGVELEESSWPGVREGEFDCPDAAVTQAWKMGCTTLQLCTQAAPHSQVPVGEADQWVIWDGCRRDREIWIGDLRPAALAHYAVSGDPAPVRNSLDLAAGAAFEDGLIPGSVSSRQIFNEYALWWVVALWEYLLYSGDIEFARRQMPVLHRLMGWVKSHVERHGGLFAVDNSWSYTLPRKGLLCAPNIVLCAAYGSAAKLCQATGADGSEFLSLAESHRRLTRECYYDMPNRLFRDSPGQITDLRIWEDNNAQAILMGIVSPGEGDQILAQLRSRLWGANGATVCAPPFPKHEIDGLSGWAHNGTIWPFANAYEVGAWMKCGRIAEGLELLKRFTGACAAAGTGTIWEMIHADGSLPQSPDRRYLLSLCHSWGARQPLPAPLCARGASRSGRMAPGGGRAKLGLARLGLGNHPNSRGADPHRGRQGRCRRALRGAGNPARNHRRGSRLIRIRAS